MKTIAVLGAGGHTGRFVMAELERRGARGRALTRSGRFTPAGGVETACGLLDLTRPEALARALSGADAVINCAGPFLVSAVPAAEAALLAGVPYLDLSAEQMAAQDLFERFDARARAAGTVMLPSMAFFGGLAELLAASLLAPQDRPGRIELAVALDSWHATAGTRLTGQRNTHPRLIVRDHQLVTVPSPPPGGVWDFPEPFGRADVTCVALSEVILIHRHLKPAELTSYMNLRPLADLGDPDGPPPQAADARGRSNQSFVLDVRVEVAGQTRRVTAHGRDIYAISAPLIVTACLALLEGGPLLSGVRGPSELFDPRPFLAALGPDLVLDRG